MPAAQSRGSRPGGRLLLLALGVLFAAALLLKYAIAPWLSRHEIAAIPEWAQRRALYLQQVEQIDTVYIGTSRVVRGVAPQRIDAERARLGCPGQSFNLGFDGMSMAEQWDVIRFLARHGAGHLERVLFDPFTLAPGDMDQLYSDRRLARNTPHYFAINLMDISTQTRDAPRRVLITERLGDVLVFLLAFAHELMNVGQWARVLWARPELSAPEPAERIGPRGFTPLDAQAPADWLRKHREFRADIQHFENLVDRYRAQPARRAPTWWRHVPVLRMVDELEHAGIDAGVLIMPYPRETALARDLAARLAAKRPGLPVLQFNDPVRWPELFRSALWFDFGHLVHPDGTDLMARHIATQLCALSEAAQPMKTG